MKKLIIVFKTKKYDYVLDWCLELKIFIITFSIVLLLLLMK
jgi:hypothetical protein